MRARARISEKLLADLATVWEEHGQSVRTPGNLDPDEWAILRRVIDLIKTNASGAELGPVLETIENALRADQAKVGARFVLGVPRIMIPVKVFCPLRTESTLF